jgi:cysteine desulfurase/selenocysteine lyase
LIWANNETGVIFPIEKIIEITQRKKVTLHLDAVQAIGKIPIDLSKLPIDYLSLSGHKIYAPTGVGVLYANRSLQTRMTPAFVGGGMVNRLSKDGVFSTRNAPWKFEAGTPAIEAAVGLKAALEFVEHKSLFEHSPFEKVLIERFALFLSKQPGVRLLGWADQLQSETSDKVASLPEHEGILSFTMDGLHPHDLAQTLADEGVAVRAGHHCAQLLTDKLAPNGCVRISLAASNEEADLELFKIAFEKCLALREELQPV